MTKVLTLFSTILFLAITFDTNAQRVVVVTDKGEVCISDSREKNACDDGIVLFDKDEYVVRINDKEVEASTIRVKTNAAARGSRGDQVAEVFIEVRDVNGNDGKTAASRGAQAKSQTNNNVAHSAMSELSQAPAMRAPLSNICFTNRKTKETVCLSTIVRIHRCCWK